MLGNRQMQNDMNYLYIGGGAVAGYLLGANLGLTPIMGAAAGAAAGYAADMLMYAE